MRELLRRGFFLLLVRPFLSIVIGLRVAGRKHLLTPDPVIVVANHNSHLDTPLLLSLFPLKRLSRLHPVAAADYWLSSPLKRFVAETFFGIVPITRGGKGAGDPLEGLHATLARGHSLLLFPEGTRGEPEVMGRFLGGAARLAAAHRDVPVVPVHLRNAGRSLPRGTFLLVPFICDVTVGAPLRFPESASSKEIQTAIEDTVRELAGEDRQY